MFAFHDLEDEEHGEHRGGDPLTDIRHTRRIEMVIHGGHVCLPADLLRGVAMD
jgi:hypothetical protein